MGHPLDSRRQGCVLAAAVLVLALAAPATPAAQSLASVQGFVSDDTGASLPGVTIELVDLEIQERFSFVSGNHELRAGFSLSHDALSEFFVGKRRRGLRLRHAPGLRRRDARPRRHLLREHGEPQLRGLPADSRRLRPGLVEPEPVSHAAGRRTLGRHREPGRDRARAPRGAAHPRRPRQLLAPRRAGLVARPAERRPGRWRGLLRPHADAAILHRPQRHRHLSALRERHRVAGRRASCRWAPRSTTTVRRAA